MRKYVILSLLLPLAVSCYEEVIIPVGDGDPVLVLNAQMNNVEPYHSISLSVSHLGTVEPVFGADVDVYVNDVRVSSASEAYDEYAFTAEYYVFEADFQPGDEVRIMARKDGMTASATVSVPPSPPAFTVDTSSVRIASMDGESEYLQLKVGFRDLPGRSFYGVDCILKETCEYLDEEGNVIPEYTVTDSEGRGYLETGYDPVISEGAAKVSDGDLASLLTPENSYHCFSDDPIADGECTLRVLIHPLSVYLGEYNYGLYYAFGLDPDAENSLRDYGRRIHRKCFFRLRSMGFSQYHYLKALSNLETFGTDVSFLVEPTILPSNVEGGLGFVGVEMVSDLQFAYFEREYPSINSLYVY